MSTASRGRFGLAIAVLLLVATDSLAQEESDEECFDIPVSEGDGLSGGVDLDADDAPFTGNPLSSLAANWPPDLVVAPIPGRSPQMGWNLALVAGYFLTPKEEGSDVPPSVLGAYGFIAENGSSVYGVGVKLNLLDDRLRVNAGGGYADVRYRYYGKDFLPAAGLGARFVISQTHRVSLSADIAVGKDDTEFYFRVGEAF